MLVGAVHVARRRHQRLDGKLGRYSQAPLGLYEYLRSASPSRHPPVGLQKSQQANPASGCMQISTHRLSEPPIRSNSTIKLQMPPSATAKDNIDVACLDPKIVDVVLALREAGYNTQASCQGHGLPLYLPPFVAFKAAEAHVARLSILLREDAESAAPQLNWGWHIDAGFDHEHRITYRLTIENPRRPWYRWLRHKMDRDLVLLPKLLKIAAHDVQRSDPLPFVGA